MQAVDGEIEGLDAVVEEGLHRRVVVRIDRRLVLDVQEVEALAEDLHRDPGLRRGPATRGVQEGAAVNPGQELILLEAMKMKNSIKSPYDGVIGVVLAQPGQQVSYGSVLLRFDV